MRKFSTTQTSNNFMFILKHCSFLSIKSFQFSLNNKEGSENNESSFNYNKVNAPNICFDKNISKEIEESVKKIISDYNEKQSDKSKFKTSTKENDTIKPTYHSTSCDYIPRVFYTSNDDIFTPKD